jgi:hypothetical protein
MLWGMLWIVGVYGAAVVILHLLYAAHKRHNCEMPARTTFALITHNNETQIEWYLRSLLFVSWLRGRRIAIVLFDEDSSDDTLAIVRSIAKEQAGAVIQIADISLEEYLRSHLDDAIVLHRIKNSGNGKGLPVLQG